MTASSVNRDGVIMQALAELYLKQELNPLQKRIYDWWTGEGFFHASNFRETEDGTYVDLMLLIGDSLKSFIASNDYSESHRDNQNVSEVQEKWQTIPIDYNYYVLEDTPDNRTKLERLLNENIRYFNIDEYSVKEYEGKTVLRSITIRVLKRSGKNENI